MMAGSGTEGRVPACTMSTTVSPMFPESPLSLAVKLCAFGKFCSTSCLLTWSHEKFSLESFTGRTQIILEKKRFSRAARTVIGGSRRGAGEWWSTASRSSFSVVSLTAVRTALCSFSGMGATKGSFDSMTRVGRAWLYERQATRASVAVSTRTGASAALRKGFVVRGCGGCCASFSVAGATVRSSFFSQPPRTKKLRSAASKMHLMGCPGPLVGRRKRIPFWGYSKTVTMSMRTCIMPGVWAKVVHENPVVPAPAGRSCPNPAFSAASGAAQGRRDSQIAGSFVVESRRKLA